MRISDGRLLLSPTDVVDAVACSYRAATAMRVAHGVTAPVPFGGLASILSAGRQHEDGVVAAFAARGLRLVDLSGATPDVDAWLLRAERTLAELTTGSADVVLQGAVVVDPAEGCVSRGADARIPTPWAQGVPVLARRAQGRPVPKGGVPTSGPSPLLVGRPDFLVRTPSGWRVEDAKLARSLKPTALLQTALYREALAAAGVAMHDDLRLHLGNGDASDEPSRGVEAWARRQLNDVVALLADLRSAGVLDPGFSLDVEWCTACDDASPCGQQRAAADHLGGVADLRRDQARRLRAAGITTIAALAAAPAASAASSTASSPVPGLTPATFEALREQASLQVAARETGSIGVVVRPHPATMREGDVRPGLWLLPEPDPGDVFFDMEGDPLWTPPIGGAIAPAGRRTQPGLEYLFGATHDGEEFTAFWAHDRSQEGSAFAGFVEWVQARRAIHPGLHVYHYAAYEKTALTRLASAHARCGDVIDEWLASGVLIDLYTAVRQGLRAGIPSYSIKEVEHLYGRAHTGDVASAGASIEKYEEYRATGSSDVLRQIEDYNRDDCDSTRDLRDYLLDLREGALARGQIAPLSVIASPVDDDALDVEAPPPSATAELRERLAATAASLLSGTDPGAALADPAAEARRVLAGLLGYQVREEKAAWQDVFRVAEEVAGDPCAAVDDAKVLGGLVPARDPGTASGKSIVWDFTAPSQEHALTAGGALAAVAGRPVDVSISAVETDPEAALSLRVSMSAAKAAAAGWSPQAPPPLDALLPSKVVPAKAQQESLLELADLVSDRPGGPPIDEPATPRAAARALLLGRPSLHLAALPPARDGEDGVAHAVRLAITDDVAAGLCLAVQGPPGAGKSYLGAEVVDSLLSRADAAPDSRPLRIGVTANSHEVVLELLRSIHRRTPTACVRHFHGKHSTAKDTAKWTRLCPHEDCDEPALITGRREGWAAAQVVGGTAWAFARPDAPPLDVLVVDEAGQMSLGDVLACARDVPTLLLLGDPQQLAKPSAAAHPDGVAVSALEHLMRGRATMPPETGVFLDATRRMHPDVTAFISDIAYDGRLSADAVCSTRMVVPWGPDDAVAGTGLRLLPVDHTGNTQSCAQEVDAVVALVEQLLARRWQREGEVVAMSEDQVLVVSPFTAQVRALRAALSGRGLAGVRVGTVDAFQGKEAAAVVYSTAASDAESAPRGLAFLYDLHRLNVAVSRAQCLAFWVGSPGLLRPRVSTVEHVRLVNALCRFADDAVLVTAPELTSPDPASGSRRSGTPTAAAATR